MQNYRFFITFTMPATEYVSFINKYYLIICHIFSKHKESNTFTLTNNYIYFFR